MEKNNSGLKMLSGILIDLLNGKFIEYQVKTNKTSI